MEKIREGLWICPNCSTKNKGSRQNCSGCGAIRGEVAFIYDENADEITDAEEKQKALEGPDWVCSFCGVSNAFGVTVCKGCSGQKKEGVLRKSKQLGAGGALPPPPPLSPSVARPSATASPSASSNPCASGCARFGCAGFVLLFILLMLMESCDYPQVLEVTRREWHRQLGIQQYQTVLHQDWLDQVPSRGVVLSKERKIRSYKKVLTGYKTVTETYYVSEKVGSRREKSVTDLGNGRFKESYRDVPVYKDVARKRTVEKPQYRDDPVYDTYAKYNLDEWMTVQEPRADGVDDEPSWPDQGLSDSAPETIGQKRSTNRKETFEIHLKSLKNQAEFKEKNLNAKPVDLEVYRLMKKGTRWKAVISGLGNLKSVDLSKPE